ncbi:hypothetical protein HMPREF1872_00814 [Amygdalobacter nucleatus]|uniref:Uncharacterized protein n=1 Tax=Amygdalobacter nucleatus TaxID=3029274 RepID=A0A133YC59_9FIRM|nr:hypothetical protein HMPREF1872_00814 [Amygdalobacter nucleatus]
MCNSSHFYTIIGYIQRKASAAAIIYEFMNYAKKQVKLHRLCSNSFLLV